MKSSISSSRPILGAALQAMHFLTLRQFGFLVSAGFVGMYFGTNLLGMCSDYIGRRTAFISMLIWYSVFSIAGAFAPDAHMLILLRFFAGIGFGGQLVIVDTYVSEIVTQPRPEDATSPSVNSRASRQLPTAALVTGLLVPTHWHLDGWRWVMIFGGSGILASGFFNPPSQRVSALAGDRWAVTKKLKN